MLRRLFLALGFTAATGCSPAAKQIVLEDEARAMTPVPACIIPLPARKTQTGVLRSLRQEQLWKVTLTQFDTKTLTYPDNATTCTGRAIFSDPAFQEAKRIRQVNEPVQDEDILVGSGGDHIRVVWLKTHVLPDGRVVGPLALVRAKEQVAEVYSVGVYRARTPRPYFVLERMGPEVLVTVQDEGCKGIKPGIACENTTALFVPRKGRLHELATFPIERRAFAAGAEKGAPGMIEYRLTASLQYEKTGIKLFEQVIAKDPEGRELRKAEVERIFAFREVELVTTEQPLWPRIYPGAVR